MSDGWICIDTGCRTTETTHCGSSDLLSPGTLAKKMALPPNRLEIDMKKFTENVVAFLKEEDGPTAVEYAVMLALIIVVCLTAVTAIGDNAATKFQETADILE